MGGAAVQRRQATPQLRAEIARQGRRLDWIAGRLGVSKSFISKVVSGQATIAEPDARVIAALVGGDLDALFALPGQEGEIAAETHRAESVA
jgi:hypothetical protein